MLAKFSEVESERTVFKFKKRKNIVLCSPTVSLNHDRLEEFKPTLFWTSKMHYLHNVNLVSTCR